jgi:homocysteine S-methyltransferase
MAIPTQSLRDALSQRAVVLDGGLSNQLADQGQDLSGELWSARLLAEDPDQIIAAHAAYLRAGARVLISSSYQASFEGLKRYGTGSLTGAGLLADSVALARQASDAEGVPAWVAASVGPYGAILADGSEYRGRYGLSVRSLEHFHRPRLEALAAAEPDVLAMETIPDADEAQALLTAASGLDVPVWLSYTVDGAVTRAGQPLADAFALARGNDQVLAVGVNCCDPRDVRAAVQIARQATGKPVVVYPNSGERWDAADREWRGGSAFNPELVRGWLASGASLIGGCCRVGPAEIAALAADLTADLGAPSADGLPAA